MAWPMTKRTPGSLLPVSSGLNCLRFELNPEAARNFQRDLQIVRDRFSVSQIQGLRLATVEGCPGLATPVVLTSIGAPFLLTLIAVSVTVECAMFFGLPLNRLAGTSGGNLLSENSS